MDENTREILQPKKVLWNTMQISLPRFLIRQLRQSRTLDSTFNNLFNPKIINKVASIKLHGQPGRTEPEILDQGTPFTNVPPGWDTMKGWGTIDIVVPEDMVHRTKTGKISIKKTLTNVRNYPKRIGGVPSIKFTDKGLQIIDKGDSYNISNIDVLENQDERQNTIATKIRALGEKFEEHVMRTRGRPYKPGEIGRSDYRANVNVGSVAFIYLIRKHNHKCLIGFNTHYKHGLILHKAVGVGLGIDIRLMKNTKVPENMKVTAHQIGPQLNECKEKGMPSIVIPLMVTGHYNILVYRPALKTVERFEPHGQKFTGDPTGQEDEDWNRFLKTLFEESLTQYLGKLRYVPPSEVCPDIDGFQNMEAVIKQLDKFDKVSADGEGGGFCMIWSLLMADLVMSRPNIPTKTLIRDVMKAVENNSVAYAKVIRGFVIELEEECDRLFKEMADEDFTSQMVRWTQVDNLDMNFMNIMLKKVFTEIGKKVLNGFEIDLYKAGYGLQKNDAVRYYDTWEPLKTDMTNPNYNINLGHRLHITHIDDSDSELDYSDTESEVLDFTRGPPIQGQPIFDFQSNRNFGTSQSKKKII